MKKKKRHYKVVMTPEAMALREFRKEKGHTIKFVAEKIGKSEGFLRHIETGRSDFPGKPLLESILSCYGVTYKSFRHKVTDIKKLTGPRAELIELVEKVPDEKLVELKSIIEAYIA